MSSAKTSKAGSAAAKTKKEKIFHPHSRKAGQLMRASLRKEKIHAIVSKRGQRHHSLVDVYRFYYHCLPDEGVLSLDQLHQIVHDIWLTRYDEQLESEENARRKGRPKSAMQLKLEDLKSREVEEYRTGLEVIDLTYAPNVALFRKWDQKETAYIEQLRFIRISSADLSMAVVSKRGKHPTLTEGVDEEMMTE